MKNVTITKNNKVKNRFLISISFTGLEIRYYEVDKDGVLISTVPRDFNGNPKKDQPNEGERSSRPQENLYLSRKRGVDSHRQHSRHPSRYVQGNVQSKDGRPPAPINRSQ